MKSKRENSDSSSSQKGHLKKDCLARVMPLTKAGEDLQYVDNLDHDISEVS